MAPNQGCIPVKLHRDSSRDVCSGPDCSRPASRGRHSYCCRRRSSSLLGCNGDWAVAAEVTPGRGSGARPAPEGTAESRSSGGWLAVGEGRPPFRLSFLLCRPADPGSRSEAGTRCVPGVGRPGRAALGPVGAASLHPPPGPAGCTVGAEGGGDTL
ncbi:LOW QUALITY PROTEIN: hypothetical protein MC885_008121, partial [Smutsia gigantea]